MDRLDAAAQEIGAVNGVVFSGGRAFGFNTDAGGAAGAFRMNGIELRGKKVTVIGAGGAGRAAVSGLRKEGARVSIVNRTFLKAAELARRFGCRAERLDNLPQVIAGSDIVLSAVSTAGPLIKPEWLAPGQVILDANYRGSRLSEIARERGCRFVSGTDWLIAQAVPAFELFTGRQVEARTMSEALASAAEKKGKPSGISLVGMAGAGKTTIARQLASVLGLEFFDTDEAVEKEAGARIPRIFRESGEEGFRRYENEIVARLGGEGPRKVSALGGGAVSRPETGRS
jgi:shikimate dehydrogenase